jgi:hypothetical protein
MQVELTEEELSLISSGLEVAISHCQGFIQRHRGCTLVESWQKEALELTNLQNKLNKLSLKFLRL